MQIVIGLIGFSFLLVLVYLALTKDAKATLKFVAIVIALLLTSGTLMFLIDVLTP